MGWIWCHTLKKERFKLSVCLHVSPVLSVLCVSLSASSKLHRCLQQWAQWLVSSCKEDEDELSFPLKRQQQVGSPLLSTWQTAQNYASLHNSLSILQNPFFPFKLSTTDFQSLHACFLCFKIWYSSHTVAAIIFQESVCCHSDYLLLQL